MNLLYIDLFCGAGGTSTGVELARIDDDRCAKVIACVNHDKNAIASHAANHPDALHFTEDIRTLELSPLITHVNNERQRYPDALIVLWASLECTNFSKAKGGQPRDADSRTLAEHLFRYIDALKPDYIQIENVEEFMSWGELDENWKPISKQKGHDYIRWVYNVCRYGYKYDYRILNAADYGAYTTRKRFFGIFAKQHLPIVFPEPTHTKDPKEALLEKWKPVREVLDFSDEGESIFNRKKPLVDATLERIYAGLIKFVAGGKDAFLVKWNSKKGLSYNSPGIDEPCPTVVTQNRLGIARVDFLTKNYSGKPEDKVLPVSAPAGTITTVDRHSFISAYYGNGDNIHDINSPAPTVTTKDRLAKVTSFFANQYSGGGQLSTIEEPCPTVTTTPKQNIVVCKPYIMNPQFDSSGGDIDRPCFTLIARMDKRPPYLIFPQSGAISNMQKPADSPAMAKIKEFMQLYGIVDIKMRMLRVQEFKQIMGFPHDYTLIGNQSEQKKFIGNAVEVNMARVLCEVLASTLHECKAAI